MSTHHDFLKALAAALQQCNEAGDPMEPPVSRISIGPIDPTTADSWNQFHSVDLTASGLIEALKMHGLMPRITPAEYRAADIRNTPEDQAMFVKHCGGLAAEMQDVFDGIDPLAVQTVVLDHRDADLPNVIQAIDDVLGDRYDPYADEDGDL